MRKIAVVPTLLTLGNGICGFVAIALASKIMPPEGGRAITPELAVEYDFFFAISGWLIIAAMVFDMLDGYVARLSKTASKFGGELDSLCDAISFGVAPAFLLLKMGPGWEPHARLHQVLAGIAALYMVCTILRLARFNVDNTPDPAAHKRFRGLPSPGAAGCVASLAVLRGEFPAKLVQHWGAMDLDTARETVQRIVEIVSPLGAFIVALLMVSTLPYPHVTKQWLRGRRHVWHLIQVLLVAFVVVLMRELALAIVFWGYALGLPLRYLVMRHVLRETPSPTRLDDGLPR